MKTIWNAVDVILDLEDLCLSDYLDTPGRLAACSASAKNTAVQYKLPFSTAVVLLFLFLNWLPLPSLALHDIISSLAPLVSD